MGGSLKFNRAKIIADLLSMERVAIRGYEDGDESLFYSTPPDVQLMIGAFCPVSISFASVPGFPEIAHANIASMAMDFTAGETSENEMARRVYEAASKSTLLQFVGPKEGIASWADRKRASACHERDARMFAGMGTPPEEVVIPQPPVDDCSASKFCYGRIRRLDSRKRLSSSDDYTTWYEDVSREDEEDALRSWIRKGYAAVLSTWADVFPGFLISGCHCNEVRWEYRGHSGSFAIEDHPRNGKSELVAYIDFDVSDGCYCGNVSECFEDIDFDKYPQSVVSALEKSALAFKAKIDSLLDDPVVVTSTLSFSNYRQSNVPFESTTLYPSETPESIYNALYGDILYPVKLAKQIRSGADLRGYRQVKYDAQHDVEHSSYSFSYDPDHGALTFSSCEIECDNIDRLPTFKETETFIVRNLPKDAFQSLALLEERDDSPDPHLIEWTLRRTDNEDGSFTYDVAEFPELSATSDAWLEAYDMICEKIEAEITRREEAGEDIPAPLSFKEADEFLGR